MIESSDQSTNLTYVFTFTHYSLTYTLDTLLYLSPFSPTDARVRALAASWARRDHQLSNWLLEQREQFGLVEVLKAVTLLDTGRNVRVQEKKMKQYQMQASGKVKPRVMGKHKSTLDNLKAIKPRVNI